MSSVATERSRTPAALVLAMHASLVLTTSLPGVHSAEPPPLHWESLPDLPDREGFAAMFAGVYHHTLIAAGGANFPDQRPWDGGIKVWHDTVYVLEQPLKSWRSAGRLPRPLAYGVSATTQLGVLCAGGSDAERHHADVFALRWDGAKLTTHSLPQLPRPCANLCGAVLDNTLYLAGGSETPTATRALKTFWALDLDNVQAGWQELEPWSGPGRMLAVAGVADGSFFLFSGASLHADADGKPARTYLRDAHRFTPGHGWKRLADLPRAAVAAPSPAMPVGGAHLCIVSGDDGVLAPRAADLREQHPGFPADVLALDVQQDTWATIGKFPKDAARGDYPPVTVPVVQFEGGCAIISGEARPGIRTPKVWRVR
jgi:N-acetylneuraminate epimerase